MRILHTSDWHLGQHFFGQTRQAEHVAFVDWLLNLVVEKEVDVLLIAGDVFDTGTPPSYARELYHHCLAELSKLKVQCVVLGGNHDSVAMLNESSGILARLNITVVPGLMTDPMEHVIPLHNRQGTQQAWLCALPYLRPRDLVVSQAGQTQQQKQAQLLDAIQQQYHSIKLLADQQAKRLPIVGTGHLTTLGASVSESVRDLYIGLLDAFPADAFPDFDYLALGHIHRAQRVAGSEVMRYCGSPIPLSFDEAQQQKKVLLVDLLANGLVDVTEQEIPEFRHLMSLKTSLAELPKQLENLAQKASKQWPAWLEIRVDSDAYLSDLQPRIEALTAELPIEVLRIRREHQGSQEGLAQIQEQQLQELSVEEVFSRRLALEELDEAQREALVLLHKQLLESLVVESDEL
ncbi:exonuclease subunit SbcD [Nitrincola schmidtii]|uniref:exonuclease subunit SbcD n=1 Tax=Nitrincola schmidtii TaxID=1730894 RepID=UPI00124E3458|nr:exonuclease subunit SbcD [Nitrincola schmidtii]